MAAPRFQLSPSEEGGAPPGTPKGDRETKSSSSSLESVSPGSRGGDWTLSQHHPGLLGRDHLSWGDSGYSRMGLAAWGSQTLGGAWGGAVSNVPCPNPGFLVFPRPAPCLPPPNLWEGEAELGGKWLQPVFPINIPKWPLAGSGAGSRGGERRPAAPSGAGPMPSCKAVPMFYPLKPPEALPLCGSKAGGVLCSKAGLWRGGAGTTLMNPCLLGARASQYLHAACPDWLGMGAHFGLPGRRPEASLTQTQLWLLRYHL